MESVVNLEYIFFDVVPLFVQNPEESCAGVRIHVRGVL